MKKLLFTTLLLTSLNSFANCEIEAGKAYDAMLSYQITGKTNDKEIKQVARVINMFDKKYEAVQYMYKAMDQCNTKGVK